MLNHVKLEFLGKIETPCGVCGGVLKLPEGCDVDGELIAFGEDESYLHCIISGSGAYYGVFKHEETNHLYHHILRLNT